MSLLFGEEVLFEQLERKYGINLFLGAGFSVCAKNNDSKSIMLGPQLKDYLVKHFELSDFNNMNLSKVCGFLKKTKKGDLYHLLRSEFTISDFDERYRSLFKIYVRNVFTTNIDDLIEKIYMDFERRNFVSDVKISGRIENPGISLFKLHGSITYPAEIEMYFTPEEVSGGFLREAALFHAVSLKIASYPTLIWGANLEDGNTLNLFNIQPTRGFEAMPKWILVLPNKEYDGDANYYKSLGFHIIRGTTNDLLEYFFNRKSEKPSLSPTMTGKNQLLKQIFNNEYIEHIKKAKHPVRPISVFYQGDEPTWSDILSGQPVKLSHYSTAEKKIKNSNKVHISGSPASGKTTLLMQLAIFLDLPYDMFYFSGMIPEKADLFISKIESNTKVVVFLDNLADNVDAYRRLSEKNNIILFTAERELNYEVIRHLVKIPTNSIMDLSELANEDIQRICDSMHRPNQRFNNEKVSLLEIVYRIYSGTELRYRIEQIVDKIRKESNKLLDFYTLLTYVRYTNVYASMDMLYAYYSEDDGMSYVEIYDMVNHLRSLIDEGDNDDTIKQDQYSLRSHAFAEMSLLYVQPNELANMLEKFHRNVHRSLIDRYDVFGRKAFDADITTKAFKDLQRGRRFYENLLNFDDSPFIKHQYALFLKRRGDNEGAWNIIDQAYTQTKGRVFSINNSHAMILFSNNIDKQDDSRGTVQQTLKYTFDVLENCLERDARKLYHILTYANHAKQYHERFKNKLSNEYIQKATKYINEELDKDEYIPRVIYRQLNDIRKQLITINS